MRDKGSPYVLIQFCQRPLSSRLVTINYDMLIILAIVVLLGFWALRLMEQAFQSQEFSRMLAGTLVAVAAGGVLTCYFLMSDTLQMLFHLQAQPSSPYSYSQDLLSDLSWLD